LSVAPPKQEIRIEEKFKDISTYNGGETEKYKWSQSIKDVTV